MNRYFRINCTFKRSLPERNNCNIVGYFKICISVMELTNWNLKI